MFSRDLGRKWMTEIGDGHKDLSDGTKVRNMVMDSEVKGQPVVPLYHMSIML